MTTVEALTLYTLAVLAVGLTATMFLSREQMLGFPSVLFWAILGAYIWPFSSTAWGDWEYYLGFSSVFGMTIFCALAAYGMREKDGGLGEEEEKTERETDKEDEEEPNKQSTQLRAKRRQKRAIKRRDKVSW